MARYDFRSPRLYVEVPLAADARVALDTDRRHYLVDVLRLAEGDHVLVFNGRDGEWTARLAVTGKRNAHLIPEDQTRAQTPPGNLHYLFAPLKRSRLDYMVQKAVELGVSRLQPVMTRHTHAERVNLDRMRANVVEAAEQCGILSLAEVAEPVRLDQAVAALAPERHLVFCDEDAPTRDPVQVVREGIAGGGSPAGGKGPAGGETPAGDSGGASASGLAVLIGPEGGFDDAERALLCGRPGTLRIALGPRILRADTAAVAALAIVQAAAGDWR